MQRLLSGIFAAMLLIAVGVVAFTPAAHADDFTIWCWDDPVVELNGQVFNIQLGVFGPPNVVRRSVQVADTTLFIPQGMRARVLRTTNTYFNETVRFIEVPRQGGDLLDPRNQPGAQVRVMTRFQATQTLPAAMAVNGVVVDQGTTRGILTTTITVR